MSCSPSSRFGAGDVKSALTRAWCADPAWRSFLRTDRPLHPAADRAGLPDPPVPRHPLAGRGALLGEAFARLAAQAVGPIEEDLARRREEPLDLLAPERAREPERREARAVEDLVGVGVADPAE